MRRRIGERWSKANDAYLQKQQVAYDIVGELGSCSRVLRMIMQSAVLGVGAYLVINQQATAGVMLAATILAARALAPAELAIANWRSFVTARQSWRRLDDVLAAMPAEADSISLPHPARNLRVTAITLVPPGMAAAALHEVSFTLAAGSALGVIGPSGSGKSSLARALVGVWRPVRGAIRLDGATLDQWSPDALGGFIGYLPQEVELFDGTVAENIARFDPDADPGKLIAAAGAAGVHDVILRLPQGYKTQVGEGGATLSGGQRQRIALARALYGDPFLVVLDEPNSNLDAPGEEALTRAIRAVRARGGIAVVVAHRPSAVAAVDQVLVLNEGRVQAFGARDQNPPASAAVGTTRATGGLQQGSERREPAMTTAGESATAGSIRAHLLAIAAATMVVVGGIGVMGASTELAGAIIASGALVVESNVKKVQHPTGGIVGELLVQRRHPRQRRRPRHPARRDRRAGQCGHGEQEPRRAVGASRAARGRARRHRGGRVSTTISCRPPATPRSAASSPASAGCSSCAARRSRVRRRSCASASRSSRRRCAASPSRPPPRRRRSDSSRRSSRACATSGRRT